MHCFDEISAALENAEPQNSSARPVISALPSPITFFNSAFGTLHCIYFAMSNDDSRILQLNPRKLSIRAACKKVRSTEPSGILDDVAPALNAGQSNTTRCACAL
jgi:hypothetical protein